MKCPTQEQMDTAIMWLRSNEGVDGESERCEAVAAWLDDMMLQKQLREAARSGGVPVAALRRKLRSLPRE